MTDWQPTQAEVDQIVTRAGVQVRLRSSRPSDVLELPGSAGHLDPPDADGFVGVGWIIHAGDGPTFVVWWHPGRGEGPLRRRP